MPRFGGVFFWLQEKCGTGAVFLRMRAKKIKKWLTWIAIVYVAIGAAFYFLQDLFLFHPVSLKRDHKYAFSIPHRDISLPVNADDTVNLVDFLPADSIPRGVVLYFHGNKKNISWYAAYPPYFTKHGYEVIMIDYPGFGKSTGRFTEEKLYNWSQLVYQLARSRFGADSIIIYGKSMGTGIAAHLAAYNPCKRLILETPYYDFPSVVSRFLPIYPVRWMLHYEFPLHRYLGYTTIPITIFHGTDDGVISYSNAKRLEPLLKKGDEFITVKGGHHNDLFKFELVTQKIDSLLEAGN